MKTPEEVDPKRVMDLSPDVCQWLEDFLKDRFRQAEVMSTPSRIPQFPVFSVHTTVATFLESGTTWNIKVDVVGFVHHAKQTNRFWFL